MLSMIVAYETKTGGIGKAGALPWNIPADLQHFKRVTSGKSVIMGSATFFSIGRVLPNRTSWVLTRDAERFKSQCIALGIDISSNVHVVEFDGDNAPEDLLAKATWGNDRWWVIGGGRIYRLFLQHCETVLATEIRIPDAKPEDFDTFFDFDGKRSEWSLLNSVRYQDIVDEDYDGPAFSICTYVPASALEDILLNQHQQYWEN